jgi:hypothetical protein
MSASSIRRRYGKRLEKMLHPERHICHIFLAEMFETWENNNLPGLYDKDCNNIRIDESVFYITTSYFLKGVMLAKSAPGKFETVPISDKEQCKREAIYLRKMAHDTTYDRISR